MRHQLLAPIDTAARLPADTTASESIRIWIDLMKAADKLLMAGLAREVGQEHVREAYRRWYTEQSARHGQHLARLAGRLHDLGG